MIALLVMAAAADSSDTARRVHVQPRRLLRAVPPPRLLALSEAVADNSIVRQHAAGALEEGSAHNEAVHPAVAVQQPGATSRRLLIASLLCLFFGGFGAHHLYLGRNVAALQCLLTFNYFGLGMPFDLLRMRRLVRELNAAEAAEAAEAAGAAGGAAHPVRRGASGAAAADGKEAAQRRLGLFGCLAVLLRLAVRMVPQFVFGRWLGTMSARALPDAMPQARAWLHAAGGAVAVWLSVATAGTEGRPHAAAAQILAAAAAGPLLLEPRMLAAWPELGEGAPSVLAAMAAANLPTLLAALGWRRCEGRGLGGGSGPRG